MKQIKHRTKINKTRIVCLLMTALLCAACILGMPMVLLADSETQQYIVSSIVTGHMRTDSDDDVIAYVTVNDMVNLRSGPGKGYSIIQELDDNAYYFMLKDIVYSQNDGLYFGKTVWNGRSGWISLRQVSVVRDETGQVQEPDFYIATSKDTAIYENADSYGTSVGKIPSGQMLHVTDMFINPVTKGVFVKVTFNGVTGWLLLDDVSLVKENANSGHGDGSSSSTEKQEKVLYKATVYNTGNAGLELHVSDSESSQNIVIPEGTEIPILEIDSDGHGHTKYNGKKGWVNLRYTKVVGNYPPQQPSYGIITNTEYFVEGTNNEGLQLRTAPSPYVSSYGVMPEGSVVVVSAIESGWAYLTYNGMQGWAGCDYLGGPQQSWNVTVHDSDRQGVVLKRMPDWYSETEVWLTEGTPLTIEHVSNGIWGYTHYSNTKGWIDLRNTKVESWVQADEPTWGQIETYTCIVSGTEGEGLELRVGPSQHKSTYGEIPEGTKLSVTAICDEWAYTEYNGTKGWAHTMFLEEYPRKVQLSRNIEEGMTGDDVTIVQERLHDLGYLDVEPDGIYGQKTTEAVKEFQRVNGLGYSDGIVSEWTANKLNGEPIAYADRVADWEYAECYKAYADILSTEKDALFAYDGLTDGYEPRNILIQDICGNELPELIYVKKEYPLDSGNSEIVIKIVSYQNGEPSVIYSEKIDKTENESGYWHYYLYQKYNDSTLYGYRYYGQWDGDGIEEFYKFKELGDGSLGKENVCYSEWDKDGIFLYCEANGEERNTPGYYEVTEAIQNSTRSVFQYNDGCGKFIDEFIHIHGCSALTFDEAMGKVTQ